jgi:hypothetical protein
VRWRALHLVLVVFALAATGAGALMVWHGVLHDHEDSTIWNGIFTALPLLAVGLGLLVFVVSDARRGGAGRGGRVHRG